MEGVMAVYLQTIAEADLAKACSGSKNVLIAGCPACASIGYALKYDVPIYTMSPTGFIPTGTRHQIKLLSRMLSKNGMKVHSWVKNFPFHLCEIDENRKSSLAKKFGHVDTVIVLSCEKGAEQLKDIMKDKNVICGMTAKGIMSIETKMGLGTMLPKKETLHIKYFIME
jgi:hypothetical protein